MPPDRPVTEIVPLPACVSVPMPPAGDEVTVYEVIVEPPFDVGAVKATVAVVCPVAVATPIVGAPDKTPGTIPPLVAVPPAINDTAKEDPYT